MLIYEQINAIRNAKVQDKLVVFVGAGVSANSGLPSWGELIKEFAELLNYKWQPPKTFEKYHKV